MDLTTAFVTAFRLVVELEASLVEIVVLSLLVSFSAVVIAASLGMPLGALVALARFPGRGVVITLLNALMGLPPVVAGLLVYLMLSRAGPLGELGLLFTPGAMIVAQTLLVLPIVAALTRQTVADLDAEYAEQLKSLRVPRRQAASPTTCAVEAPPTSDACRGRTRSTWWACTSWAVSWAR